MFMFDNHSLVFHGPGGLNRSSNCEAAFGPRVSMISGLASRQDSFSQSNTSFSLVTVSLAPDTFKFLIFFAYVLRSSITLSSMQMPSLGFMEKAHSLVSFTTSIFFY